MRYIFAIAIKRCRDRQHVAFHQVQYACVATRGIEGFAQKQRQKVIEPGFRGHGLRYQQEALDRAPHFLGCEAERMHLTDA
ncbi:hypothetical protein D3C84_716550 [compost metagenome]